MEISELTVKDLMSTPVVGLEQGLSLFLADWLMKEKRVRHLPVLDGERRVVGLVTHRTILAAKHGGGQTNLVVPVSDIMVSNPLTLGVEETAAAAARFMVENKIGCAVIVDDEQRAIGIVTESDFIELAARVLFRVPRIAIDDFMTTDLVTLTEDQPIEFADELMRAGRFRHLPVVDGDGRLTGLVTHRDLLATHLRGDSACLSGDIASRDVWTISTGSSARNAARMLADHAFGCLPVIEDDVLVGLITEADVVMLLVRLLTKKGAFGRTELPTRLYMSSPVQCIDTDSTLEQARSIMSSRAISCLGVVSARNHLVGILTASDLLEPDDGSSVAADRMTRDVVTADVLTPVAEIAQTLVDEAIHRVFVTDEGRLAGVLSVTDLVYAVRDTRVHTPLKEIMSPIVMTIAAGEPVEAGRRFLNTARIHALIVLEDGWPIGILSQRELLESGHEGKVIDDAMIGRVLCLPESTPAFRAAAQMAELGIDHVVCLRAAQPSGVVTSFDMAKLSARSLPGGDEASPDYHLRATPSRS